MWHYMYFIIYLQNRPQTKFTGAAHCGALRCTFLAPDLLVVLTSPNVLCLRLLAGSEAYVWNMLSKEDIGWFPMQRAIVLSHDAGESVQRQMQRRTDARLDNVEKNLAKVAEVSKAALDQLGELKAMLEQDQYSDDEDDAPVISRPPSVAE